ncbi:MAG: glycosyltransferase family 2 protein [Acidobacteriota bacterium]
MPPLVSIVIPSFNSGRFLSDAVRSAFVQTYPDIECLVVDDGSTDDTTAVLVKLKERYPRLKILRKTNGGPSSARNLGLKSCSGGMVSFLDADDVLLPDKIERQVHFLQEHPGVGLVYGDYLLAREDLHPIALFSAEMPRGLAPLEALCYRNWFNPVVTLVRREVVEQVGQFDEDIAVGEDWDYWIRCAKVARLAYLPGPVALYRQHPQQIHRDHVRMRECCIQVANKNFHSSRSLRAAMASINVTDAKYLWRQRRVIASAAALLKYAIGAGLGLHAGYVSQQIEATFHSQLRSL